MSDIKVKIDGSVVTVERAKYVEAKTKQLREFGYPTLTEAEVNDQIDALLQNKSMDDGLNVIGMFMEDEIVTPQ